MRAFVARVDGESFYLVRHSMIAPSARHAVGYLNMEPMLMPSAPGTLGAPLAGAGLLRPASSASSLTQAGGPAAQDALDK